VSESRLCFLMFLLSQLFRVYILIIQYTQDCLHVKNTFSFSFIFTILDVFIEPEHLKQPKLQSKILYK
jgi:hypothetical protein